MTTHVYAPHEGLIRLQFEARDFSLLPRRPVHNLLSGRLASRLRGRGLTFEERQRYRPGDDIRCDRLASDSQAASDARAGLSLRSDQRAVAQASAFPCCSSVPTNR